MNIYSYLKSYIRQKNFRPSSFSVTLRLPPPLKSETGLTGELWSKTNIPSWKTKRVAIIFLHQKYKFSYIKKNMFSSDFFRNGLDWRGLVELHIPNIEKRMFFLGEKLNIFSKILYLKKKLFKKNYVFLLFLWLIFFFVFFLNFFEIFMIIFKVTRVTTKNYGGYYWTLKMA